MAARGCTPARRTAHDVLMRVSATAAFGSRALDVALCRGNLPARDRAFVTELVYGTLRHGSDLDSRLGRYLQEPIHKLPPPVRVALQLGAYQLLHTRVPAHSAVDESVILVRRFGRLAGVVNAVLRRLAQERRTAADAPDNRSGAPNTVAELAVWGSHPAWLVAQVAERLGFAEASAWVQANNVPAPLALRVQSRRTSRAAVIAALEGRGLTVTPHAAVAHSLLVHRSGRVTRLPGFAAGAFTVQDPAAALVGLYAAPQPGQLVLDVCAAPGGKAMHLAELMGDSGIVVAMDVHPGKSRLIAAAAQRLHLPTVRPVVGDATSVADLEAALAEATDGQRRQADIVLVDAPCSGLGTLRRNAELRRCGRERVAPLAQLQARILASAAQCVAPGGSLVYAVCTVTPEEGPEQISKFCALHPEFRPVAPPAALQIFAEGEALRTWTHRDDMDSFFSAKLQRCAST